MPGNKILPPVYLFVSLALILLLHFLVPLTVIIAYPWSLFGCIPLVIGIVLNLAADKAFKIFNTTVKPFQDSTALITTGVFRISRHPMYLGMILILLGLAILMGSLTPFSVVILFAVCMDRIFIRVEERMLEENFGKAWRQYRAKVRRWI